MYWSGDDPGAERRPRVAGDRAHGHAARLRQPCVEVQEALRRDPHDGSLFVFRGRRGDLVKVIWHDGQGACLFAKRLERGRFLWPSLAEGAVTITTGSARLPSVGDRLAQPREAGGRPRSAEDKALQLLVEYAHLGRCRTRLSRCPPILLPPMR